MDEAQFKEVARYLPDAVNFVEQRAEAIVRALGDNPHGYLNGFEFEEDTVSFGIDVYAMGHCVDRDDYTFPLSYFYTPLEEVVQSIQDARAADAEHEAKAKRVRDEQLIRQAEQGQRILYQKLKQQFEPHLEKENTNDNHTTGT